MLHAQIVGRLLKSSPHRQQVLLRWAAESYSQLGEMQRAAWEQCSSEEERTQVNLAITYFAEIYSHRLFRVMSPENPVLFRPVSRDGASVEEGLSVAEAMNGITLVTPERLLLPEHRPRPQSGLETLTRHCEDWLGKTYKLIHSTDSIPVFTGNKPLADVPKNPKTYQVLAVEDTDALSVIPPMNTGAARNAADQLAYNEESHTRANAMRWAQKIRSEGNDRGARDIESALRSLGGEVSGEDTAKDASRAQAEGIVSKAARESSRRPRARIAPANHPTQRDPSKKNYMAPR